MAIKLSAYREGSLYMQVDVPAGGLRLGRGPDNQVILEDQQKRVSRVHAEVKPEKGRYVLLDRDSANGTYVEGRRVTRAEISTGVPFTIGPYRLVLEESTEMDPRSLAALDPEQVTGAFRVEPDEGDTIERSAGPLTLSLQTGTAAQGAWRVWVALGAVVLALLLGFVFWK